MHLIELPRLDSPSAGTVSPQRRCSRLALSLSGTKKSSLRRAQDLKCKKLKMVRFVPSPDRACISSVSSPLLLAGPEVPPISSPDPSAAAAGCSGSSTTFDTPPCDPSPKKDCLIPLSAAEVQSIKKACGIIDPRASPSSSLSTGGGLSV